MSTVTRDIALRVLAETKEYAAGIAEIPGMTARESAKAGLAFQREATKSAFASVREYEKAAKAAAAALEDVKPPAIPPEVAAAVAALTDEEKTLAKAMADGEAAARAKAEALGITVAQLRQVEAATERAAAAERSLAAEQAKAAATARARGEAAKFITDAERRELAAMVASEAAEKSKAAAMGISVGQLRQLQSAIEKKAEAERAATRVTEEAARVTGAAGSRLERVGDVAGRVGENFSKLGGAADMVPGPMGDIVRTVADVADVFEVASVAGTSFGTVLRAISGPAAIAIGAIAAMVAVVDDYAESKREAIRVEEQFKAAIQPLEAALASARAEHELLTQAQAAGEEELRAYVEVAELHATVDGKVAESTKALREEREKLAGQLKEISDQNGFDARLAKGRLAQLDEEIGAAEAHGRELKRLAEANRALKDSIEGRADATGKAADASGASASAAEEERRALEALRLANEQASESAAAAAETAKRYADLGAESEAALRGALAERIAAERELALLQTGKDAGARAALEERFAIEAANAALADQVVELKRIRDERLALATTVSAQETAEADFRAASIEAERAAQTKILAIRTEFAQKAAERTVVYHQQTASTVAGIFGDLSSAAGTFSEVLNEKNRKASLLAFRIHQGGAAAQAGVNTGLMVSNALTQVPIPWNAAAAVAAGAAGAAQVAAILAQKPPMAHVGETFVMDRPGPMEVDRRLRVGEAVVTGQGAELLGRERIARANRGQDPDAGTGGGGSLSVYGHRVFGRFMKDVTALPNPLRAAIASGRGTGFRTRHAS